MNLTALSPAAPGAAVPLERLADHAALTEREKIAEAARQFEAMLLRQILAETQKPVIASRFADHSTTANIYRDLMGNQLADSIAKSGAIGLAKSLEQQLNRQLAPALDPAPVAAVESAAPRLVTPSDPSVNSPIRWLKSLFCRPDRP